MSARPRFDDLQAWLDWQEGLHSRSIDMGLDRVREVADNLSLLQPRGTVITVGGTNGKGSVVALLESLLLASGLRVGCYTSPHLLHYRERIRLAGQAVDDARIVQAFNAIDQARGAVSLTYFEFGTLAAVWLMQQAQVDVMVLEVGLGGRLDACNLWDAHVAVITSIGLDHQQYLGNTRESVGREKAGIFRLGRPALCADRQPPDTLARRAQAVGADFAQLGRDFDAVHVAGETHWQYRGDRQWTLPLPGISGARQCDNASVALRALECLGLLDRLDNEKAGAALQAARLPGRCQRWPDRQRVVLDVAHNPQAASVLADWLGQQAGDKPVAVCAMLADKDPEGVIEALGDTFSGWYLGQLDGDRAGQADVLERALASAGQTVRAAGSSVAQCLARALDDNPQCDIVVFGSFYTVAQAMQWLEDNPPSAS